MKIKMFELISIKWVEEEIKICEGIQRKSPYNDFNAGRLDVLETIKEELLSSNMFEEKIKDAFEAGSLYEARESDIYIDEYIESLKD